MTADHDALSAAVLARPDDDFPRLVFADYLDEIGHPAGAARAAFIRLQCAAARLPTGSPERAEREAAAAELLALYGAGWGASLPDWVLWHDTSVHYERGFVGAVTLTPRRLVRDGHELFAVAPVTAVRLRTRTGRIDPYLPGLAADLPFLTGVRDWAVGPTAGRTDWHAIVGETPAAFPLLTALRGLERLALRGCHIPDAWVVRFTAGFAGAAFAGTLRELDLSDNSITDAGAHTLAAGRGLDHLDRLGLSGNRIGPVGTLLLRRRFGDRVHV